MGILPVLDVMDGVVVRGVGGRRHAYRPIVSKLVDSAAPLKVAAAFRDHFGLHELYLADLDALGGQAPALDLVRALRENGFHAWVDAGVRTSAEAALVREAGAAAVVAGLETVPTPKDLQAILQTIGPDQVIFSLDLQEGRPMTRGTAWDGGAWEIAQQAVAGGARRILMLDMANVGMGQGVGTEGLCARLHQAYPQLELAAGGGVRDREDLTRLRAAGVTNVLVASALHDGRLQPEDWED